METKQKNAFGFTAKVDEPNLHKVLQHKTIEDLLNQHLKLSDYSTELSEIVFVFLAASPKVSIPENDYKKYRRKYNAIEVGINMDYERLNASDKTQSITLLAQTYLKGIASYMKHKNFDDKKFYADVKQLFVDHKLIQADVEEIRKGLIRKIEQINDQKLIIQLDDYLNHTLAKAV